MSSTLPKFYTKTLANGLQIVAIPMHNNTGVISTDIFYKVGSRNEVLGKTGIAHMLEHLNFKSTKKLAAGEFDVEVKKFGGVNNASTGFDQTHYFIKSSKQNLERALELFAELMANLNLKDEEFQPERDVVAEERRWRTDNNPMGYLYFRLFNTAYVYHPYHWTPIGFMGDIQTWDIEDIKAFHSRYYQPSNAIVVIAGDITQDEVFTHVEKHFASIKNHQPPVENIVDVLRKDQSKHFIEPAQDGARRVIVEKESEVEMVAIAYHIPDFTHPDQIALSAISELLSSGKSSRLYQSIVDEKQLANQIFGYNMENIDPGLFIFVAVCNPGIDATQVEKEILKELALLQAKPITKAELDKVKLNIHAEFVFNLESSSSVTSLFGSYFTKGDITPLLELETRIQALTPKDIQQVARKYFVENQSTTIILRHPKEKK